MKNIDVLIILNKNTISVEYYTYRGNGGIDKYSLTNVNKADLTNTGYERIYDLMPLKLIDFRDILNIDFQFNWKDDTNKKVHDFIILMSKNISGLSKLDISSEYNLKEAI